MHIILYFRARRNICLFIEERHFTIGGQVLLVCLVRLQTENFCLFLYKQMVTCSETTQTRESQFHISTPLGNKTRVPHDGKQMGSPLDQWDMVSKQWNCRLCTGLPPAATMSVVKLEGGPAVSVKPGQISCVRSSGTITLSARRPSDGSGRSPPQTRSLWSITSDHQCGR